MLILEGSNYGTPNTMNWIKGETCLCESFPLPQASKLLYNCSRSVSSNPMSDRGEKKQLIQSNAQKREKGGIKTNIPIFQENKFAERATTQFGISERHSLFLHFPGTWCFVCVLEIQSNQRRGRLSVVPREQHTHEIVHLLGRASEERSWSELLAGPGERWVATAWNCSLGPITSLLVRIMQWWSRQIVCLLLCRLPIPFS